MDVVKAWADMVKCRPVDLGNAFAKRLRALEIKIRADTIERAASLCSKPAKFTGEISTTRLQAWRECALAIRAMNQSPATGRGS